MRAYKRYAPLGLVLAGLAALASFGLYIVQREWNLSLQISLGLVVLGIAIFIFLDPARARSMVSGRQARYGSNALVLSLAFVGILIVVNVLIFQNTQDWNLRWDLTEDQSHTLAPETLETLGLLPDTVLARAFYSSQNPAGADRARDLLNDYKFFSDGKFDFEFIDPNSDPLAAQQANVTRDGTIVLEMSGNQEQVSLVSEREVTSAIIRLMNPGDQKIYLLSGHGEKTYEQGGDSSLSQIQALLENKNYVLESLNLLASNEIPPDATALVIAGPQIPFAPEEVDLIANYLDAGGSLLVMYEPLPLTQFGQEEDPLTNYLASDWGITLGNDIIVDLSSNQPFVAVANQYADHLIIQKLQGVVTVFPDARSVQATGGNSDVTLTELVQTAAQSWAETDFNALASNQEIAPDAGSDLIGPVPVAVVAENNVSGARVIVFGDSDFVSNAYSNLYGNGDLFVNSVDWAAEQEDIISLTPKAQTQRFLLPPQRYVMGLILLGSVFVLPGLTLVSGIVVWIRRRRRG